MFAVLDVETTGLFPGGHDRIIELAVVLLDREGIVEGEWTSLVNPGRDLGPAAIHGISQRMLDQVDAPVFTEIAGDVVRLLDGRVPVGHNLRFDVDFLAAELDRLGIEMSSRAGLCTMELATRGLSRSLSGCCAGYGVPHVGAHTALGDARATAALLRLILEEVHSDGVALFRPNPLSFGGAVPAPSESQWPRPDQVSYAADDPDWIAAVIKRLPMKTAPVEADPGAVTAYADLLDRALEDRALNLGEVGGLADTAVRWGLAVNQLEEIHHAYLTALVALALEDHVITDQERLDLERVAALLGRGPDAIDALSAAVIPAVRPQRHTDLEGCSVCFTGTMTAMIDNVALTRTQCEALAARAGLIAATNVTKRLDVLVCADPDSVSGKAKKARSYGTRIMAERAFWKAIGVSVD
jgi:DNA polymerase-3 subunit epsilon